MLAYVLQAVLALAIPPSSTATARFTREVANMEFARDSLRPQPSGVVARPPREPGTLWYGTIMRRLPGDDLQTASHYVAFAVEYTAGIASRAWCDANGNGDLTDDPRIRFSAFPDPEGARSFLVTLTWTAQARGRSIPIESIIRVVLEPQVDATGGADYRLHRVYAPLGEVVLAGRRHRALLFDGNGDGLYAREFPDGLFIDLNDDSHFDIDPMSPEFAPLGVPFQMGEASYEVTSIDPEGTTITYRRLGSATELRQASVGAEAPDFTYEDVDGRQIRLSAYRGRVVLLYFWASWCGACSDQAEGLGALYRQYHPQGVEILGVSYDTDRAAMTAFRTAHSQAWPTSFSGRAFWEDPVGKLYRARRSGTIYVVDRDGRLDGTFSDLEELGKRLAQLLPSGSLAASGSD